MNQDLATQIHDMIGKENFEWLAKQFDKKTRLQDVPPEILERISVVDITAKDFAKDRNAITAIALITFAYGMAGKIQHPKYASHDILLVKVLAKKERERREGLVRSDHDAWHLPLFELITGEVGESIRATKIITGPA
ncbi:MAG: hypothetical protein P8175_11980 [Deltaproteobacteria bacterium]|jgi:hypothetical protein